MAKAKSAKGVLKAVRYIIAEIGWLRGAYFHYKTARPNTGNFYSYIAPTTVEAGKDLDGCCLEGALLLVEADSNFKDKARERLIKALMTEYKANDVPIANTIAPSIPQLNDSVWDNKLIVKALDKAIEKR